MSERVRKYVKDCGGCEEGDPDLRGIIEIQPAFYEAGRVYRCGIGNQECPEPEKYRQEILRIRKILREGETELRKDMEELDRKRMAGYDPDFSHAPIN